MKSQSVQDAVRSRIATSREQLEKSLGGIISGRPLDAESSEVRKINRFQSVAGVSYEQAVKLANNDQDAFNELKGERRLGAERIQGKSVDFVGVSFLEWQGQLLGLWVGWYLKICGQSVLVFWFQTSCF